MNFARRFITGIKVGPCFRRVATIESFRRRYATQTPGYSFPALKGRAKLMSTLRVESTCPGLQNVNSEFLMRITILPCTLNHESPD